MDTITPQIEQPDMDTVEFYELSDQLSQLMRRQVADALAIHNLTPPQYAVIKCISQNGAPMTVATLAEATHQLMPTMTGILNRLEEHGLIIRRRSNKDRRCQLVSLTPAAEAILKEFEQQRCATMRSLLSGLKPEEHRMIIRLMRNLMTKFSSQN